MEVKDWTYEDFPEFTDEVEGVTVLPTTGDELEVHYVHNVKYETEGGVQLNLQLLIPFTRNQQEMTLPCVAFVQGSAWMEQDVYAQLPMVAQLARRGYVVAIVEYRHSGIAPFPAQAVDTENAIRFLRKHANEYGILPEKMIVAGDSSGGHTAMFVGIRHGGEPEQNAYPGVSAEVKGIINYYGSVSVMEPDSNPTTVNHCLPDSPEGMEMGGVNLLEREDLRRKLSVECNIDENTELPPVLIFHGTKDRTVNTRGSVTLYRRLKECGKDVRFYLIQGADHGGAEFWTKQALDLADDFIRKCLAD